MKQPTVVDKKTLTMALSAPIANLAAAPAAADFNAVLQVLRDAGLIAEQ
jgi:hypothetical protein